MTSSGPARKARRTAASPDSLPDTPKQASSSPVDTTKAASALKTSTASKPLKTKPGIEAVAKAPEAVKAPEKAGKKPARANGAAGGAIAPADNADARASGRERDDKDRPLFEDIRYLGRLLGDVLREQEGDAVFDVVEVVRQTAVKFRREDDVDASQALEKKLRALTPEQTLSVVRTFSYFSHLANIAEDRHHNRRRIHALAGSSPQPGTIAYAIERMREQKNVSATRKMLQKFFDAALIVPVLTPHPTEVSCKSILDA